MQVELFERQELLNVWDVRNELAFRNKKAGLAVQWMFLIPISKLRKTAQEGALIQQMSGHCADSGWARQLYPDYQLSIGPQGVVHCRDSLPETITALSTLPHCRPGRPNLSFGWPQSICGLLLYLFFIAVWLPFSARMFLHVLKNKHLIWSSHA